MTYHALQRAFERYNVEFDWADINAIIALIEGGHAQYVGRKTVIGMRYIVKYQDQLFDLVYAQDLHQIVTFLEPKAKFKKKRVPKPKKKRSVWRDGRRRQVGA